MPTDDRPSRCPFCVHQYSDSDSEAELSGGAPAVPSAVPVTGESYCSCESQAEPSCPPRLRGFHHTNGCHCGEDDQREYRGCPAGGRADEGQQRFSFPQAISGRRSALTLAALPCDIEIMDKRHVLVLRQKE